MKNRRVGRLLFFTILTMTVLPMIAAIYFLDHALQTSLNLGFNQEIVRALEGASQNLKRLKVADPENERRYREQFEEIENLRLIYSSPSLVKSQISDSLKIYFGLGVAAALLMALTLAILLGRRISSLYAATFNELIRQKEKVRYLEEISSWQELAKMLAHEIKNPLTPIEILVTSLRRSYAEKPAGVFDEQLLQTEAMIREELGHLKGIVNRFSEFAKIPNVRLENKPLTEVLESNVKLLSGMFERAELKVAIAPPLSGSRVHIDSTLFRQVLANIVQNGLEANPLQPLVCFTFQVSTGGNWLQIAISNDGEPVPVDLVNRMFDPHISSKKGKENMGLGLAIVKKIIIEHDGEIAYVEEDGRPTFVISLRKAG
ncbi:MAG: PAS domain-containing sensor histidine kinase [Bdellovibrionales bacterium]